MVELPSGSRVEVRRGSLPVLLARLPAVTAAAPGGSEVRIGAPFTDRLVAKFGLPVAGWRGQPGDRAVSGKTGRGQAGPDEALAGDDAMAREAVSDRADEE